MKIALYNRLGYCRFDDQLGDDFTVCKAARTSYGSSALKGEEKDRKLIRYLLKNRHTSPFEQCSISFNIRMPIFVMRQFVRHRTFRLNEESARYHKMEDDFHIPKVWRIQSQKNKQMSEIVKESDDYIGSDPWNETNSGQVQEVCEHAYSVYEELLEQGVAREQARYILPVNLMTTIRVNIDLHNLMHFLRLRLDPHAQFEIRQLAYAMLRIAENRFPICMEAFIDFCPNIKEHVTEFEHENS